MALANLTDETKALMQKNNINPVAVGANQYIKSATPRLNAINLYSKMRNSAPMSPQITNTQNNTNNSMGTSINGLVNGGLSLMNGLNQMGVFNRGNETGSGGAISDAINSYVGEGGSDASDILSGAGDLYSLAKTWGNSGGGAAGSNFAGGYGGLIGGGINGLSSFAQSGDYKDGLQGFFSIDKDDSDVMQGIKGTINGAVTGGSVGGPWGALAGGILGLGASFLDDIQGVICLF